MHTRIALSLLLLTGLATGCTQSNAQPHSDEPATAGPEAEAAVRTANEGFYVALNEMFKGDASAMEDVWSHEDYVGYLPPIMERFAGWDDVKGCIQQQTDLKLGGEITPEDVVVQMLSPTVALVVTTESGENPNAPGGAMQVTIRSTKLFRLEDGKWMLFYDHADLLPLLAADAA